MLGPDRNEEPMAGFELVAGQGPGPLRVRLHLPHDRIPLRRRGGAAIGGDRQTRGQQLQDLPRLQGRVRPQRPGAVPNAAAGPETRGHHHRPLRERGPDRGAAEATAGGGQDRAGMASRQPPAHRRGRRRPSPDDLRGAARRPRLYRPPELRGGLARRRGRQERAASRSGPRRSSSTCCWTRLTPSARTSKAPST